MANLSTPLIELIDARVERGTNQVIGTSASPAYQWHDYTLDTWLWVMDVDLATEGTRPDSANILKAVPIADGSYGVHKVGPGAKLRLVRTSTRQSYEIVGLASLVSGQVTVLVVTYTPTAITLGAPLTYGSTWRALNYDELGDSANNGGYTYGSLPYGTLGKFDLDNNLLIVRAP